MIRRPANRAPAKPIDNGQRCYKPKRHSVVKRSGLSLLEVMIATAILASSGLVIGTMVSSGTTYANRTVDTSQALLLAENRFAEFNLSNELTNLTREQVDICPEDSNWTYRRNVEPIDELPLARVVIEIFPSESLNANSLNTANSKPTIRLVRWLPLPKDPADQRQANTSRSMN